MTDGLLSVFHIPMPCALAAGQETSIRQLLIQLIVIILAARTGASVARWFHQPRVVGEIVAGLALGPSGLGMLAPDSLSAIFGGVNGTLELQATLAGFSQVGLILLLFLVGIEFDFSHIIGQGRTAAAVSIAGVAVPFGLALVLAVMMSPRLEAMGAPNSIDHWTFALFLGTAMSITAIPILGRILIELGLQRTRLGAIVIAAAACDDVAGWTLLAAVSAIAVGRFNPGSILWMLGATAALAATLILVVRPIALPLLEWSILEPSDKPSGKLRRLPLGGLSIVLSILFMAALLSSLIGIFAIFGGFLLGASLSGSKRLQDAIIDQLSDFVTVFFLPIFFTFTGLRTNIGSLGSPEAWAWCVAVMAVAVIGKWGGCGLAAWLSGMPSGEAACVGVLMNTRALMELVVVNVGMDLGVIPPAVYCMLVLMAIGTTVMATPLATRMLRGTDYEATLVKRGFLQPRA